MAEKRVTLAENEHALLQKHVYEDGRIDALIFGDDTQGFIIARNYDSSNHSWETGEPFESLNDALDAWFAEFGEKK